MAETEKGGESGKAGAGGPWVNTPVSGHVQLHMTKALDSLKDTDTCVALPPFLLPYF